MKIDGSCSIRTLASLVAALREWGEDVEGVLAVADLVPTQIEDPDLRISLDRFRAVWNAAREATGDDALGLHVIECFDPRNVMTGYVYLASTSATARQAFERVSPFIRVAHDALDVDLSEVDGRTIFRANFRGWEDELFLAEYFIGLIVKIAPAVAGADAIKEAWFRHSPPSYADEYRRILGIEVRFDAPYNAVLGSAAELDRPLPNADEVLCALLERQAIVALARFPQVSNFAETARQQVERLLPEGAVSANAVAGALGLSDRTLRRRLRECGVSYQQLLDAVRCDLARRALARPGTSVGEVAYALGFSDTSAFHKAFRRWTGKRPSDLVGGTP